MKSLWRYNFTPDVGPYRAVYQARPLVCDAGRSRLADVHVPAPDWDYEQAKGKGAGLGGGYFNECMNGFEYQVAGHMLWEGMVTEGPRRDARRA